MYARRVGREARDFGVSGLLWSDNVLMYDRQTESLWSQVKREAVAGPLTGARLQVLPSTVTDWGKWRRRYPATTVLSLETGYPRDYSKDPYESYYRSPRGMFSVFLGGPGETEKELVAGVEVEGIFRAYPLRTLRAAGALEDEFGAQRLTLTYDAGTDAIAIRTESGDELVPIVTYWMVWKNIHPETSRFRHPGRERPGSSPPPHLPK